MIDNFDWLTPENYGKPVIPEKEPPLVVLALETLNNAEDQVLRDWIEKVFPNILDYFSLKPAKGMSLEAAKELAVNAKPDKKEKTINTLVEHKDQSLAVHLLNAVVGGWTLVKLANLEELQQRLYLAAVTLHDLNKIVLKELGNARMDGKEWDKYYHYFNIWAESLGLWKFISNEYWQDIAFLAQNAEDARGANLTLANFQDIKLSPEDLIGLAEFVRFADLLASMAYRPDSLYQEKIRAIVRRRLKDKYVIRHHRTIENRGLLTQTIHNIVLDKAREIGWIAFLFFPDGITYFAPKDSEKPDLSNLAEIVRSQILKTADKGLNRLIYRQPKGIISCKPDMKEVADVERASETLIKQLFNILGDKRTPVTGERREKIRSIPELADLDWNYPANLQVDRLAEGVRGLVDILKEYYGVTEDKAIQSLLNALDMNEYLETLKRIPALGGVPHGWYFLAGHYMRKHGSLNDAELEDKMLKAIHQVITEWGKPEGITAFAFLDSYIGQVLDISDSDKKHDFEKELNRYHRNKANRKREPICAVCNSAFDVREEFSSYTNKRVTSLSKESLRGICTVCQAEKLLRSYSLNRGLEADDDIIYLHLYPDYYFTPETALIMNRAYKSFAQNVFSDLDKELAKHNYDPKYIPRTDVFRIGADSKENEKRRVEKVEYPEGQMHGYYLLGVPALFKKPTDTEVWHIPALLTLIAPLTFGVKVVASRSTLPPYDSGADFKETVILDGVHTYWQHSIKKSSFRLDEFITAIPAAFAVYALTSQAYRDSRNFPVWNALNNVSQSLDTSPLYVFHYADRILENIKKEERKKKSTQLSDPAIIVAKKLLNYYQLLINYYQGDDPMNMIRELVDKYARFYRASGKNSSAYTRLRPLNIAAKVILESQPNTAEDDLQLMIEGYLFSLVDGVLNNNNEGYIPSEVVKDKSQRETVIQDFSQYFVKEVFQNYCRAERSLLRQNINLIRHASEAWYIKQYIKKPEEKTQTSENKELN
ncbi:type I-D CRISPR-associated protein Cas10d/Csc3 [Anabaena sp. PCC 7108]|uniref:type I-D CRISPR-associated protein Cas10d/Csc3 n=1 Tax=Anabaena sp. PCC 7108 TaxID=163908 RepID=UPI00034966C3|nr:type I-D CRISPR-associated protein Cas10d/Csc3 [Anabaena sp. PCC 7108]